MSGGVISFMAKTGNKDDRVPVLSSFAAESDDVRQMQMRELMKGIKESPVIGHGFGSYIENFIRSSSLPFSYEIEYLSFVYQMGILGFTIFILGIIGLYIRRDQENMR